MSDAYFTHSYYLFLSNSTTAIAIATIMAMVEPAKYVSTGACGTGEKGQYGHAAAGIPSRRAHGAGRSQGPHGRNAGADARGRPHQFECSCQGQHRHAETGNATRRAGSAEAALARRHGVEQAGIARPNRRAESRRRDHDRPAAAQAARRPPGLVSAARPSASRRRSRAACGVHAPRLSSPRGESPRPSARA